MRVTRGEDDEAERELAACERITGERASCPWQALNTPFVLEVIRARKWHEAGELDLRYPDGVPNVVIWGIDVYDNAFNATQVHDMREDRREAKKRADEHAEREAKR